MSSEYTRFLKKWSNVNDVSSFFGSDKPDFLRDWKLAKAGQRFEISRGKYVPTNAKGFETFRKATKKVNKLRQKVNEPFIRTMEKVD